MNHKIILAILFIFAGIEVCIPQSNQKNKETFLEAESYFLYEEFTEALPLYIQLKEQMPSNYNLDYKIGRCYLNMPYEKAKAIKYLETACKHISTTWKDGNFKETMAPLEAIFYLGDAYRINNKLSNAIESYELFKSKISTSSYDLKLVDTQIASCKRAVEAMKNPIDIDEQIITNPINTRQSETNPVVSQDESMIVYAAKLPFYNAMFYSKKVNGKWQEPVNMIPELEVDNDCYPTSLSYDGKELYVYRTNEYKGDLFVTRYENGKWTKLKKLKGAINTKYWESHASISRDGKKLYFTSNREGGYGGLDIYVSNRIAGDEWGPAQNLGPIINSEYNEDAPFIMPDDKTLYFSSFGHQTIGGYDIFYSVRNDSWSNPVNMGFPINSTDDDIFFYPLRDGEIGYSARFIPEGAGKYDLVRMNIYTDKNPRKYQVKGLVKLSGETAKNSFYLALYDKVKKDTLLRKNFTGSEVAFETIPGQYEVYISSSDKKYQAVPLHIKYGTKDTSLDLKIDLIEDKSQEAKPTTFLAKNEEKFIPSSNDTKKTEKFDVLNNANPVNVAAVKEITDSTAGTPTDSTISYQNATDTSATQPTTLKPEQTQGASRLPNFFQNHSIIYMGIGLIGIFLFLWFLIRRKKKNNNT
jgi:tetratricopeptide (TPR) repeat protein